MHSFQTLLLIDKTISFKTFKQINHPFSKIITLDYESHKIMKSNGINHEISDDYITKKIVVEIEDVCYEFSHWYEYQENLIQYHGINLGQLFYVEFRYFLVSILKKFVELTKICEKHSKTKFLVSKSTYKIMNDLSDSLKIIYDHDDETTFLYDKIHFSVSNLIHFNISRKRYQYIKNMSEKLLEKMVKTSKTDKKLILFAESDPIKFESLFTYPNRKLNFILYNRRRPLVWNKTTYDVVRKSKCILPSFNKILETLKQKIVNEQKIIDKQLKHLLLEEKFFQTYFSIYNHSFWYVIKDDFIKLYQKRFSEAVQEILIAENVLENFKPSAVVLWSESGFNEQIIIELAKKNCISINLIQHGIIADTNSERNFKYNRFSGTLPKKSNKFLVWNKSTKDYAKLCGFSNQDIIEIGNPIYDSRFLNKKKHSKEDFILFITAGPNTVQPSGYNTRLIENYYRQVSVICKKIKDLDKRLIVRPHPFSNEFDVSDIVKKSYSSALIDKKSSITTLLENASVIISLGISTIIFEAQLLRKPIIYINSDHDMHGIPKYLLETPGLMIKIEEITGYLSKILENKPFRDSLVVNNAKYLSEEFFNSGSATEKLLSFLS